MLDIKKLMHSALEGNAESHYIIGKNLALGKAGFRHNPSLAFAWYELSSRQNNSDAVLSLGWCYFKGMGCEKDVRKAAELFIKSAYLGNSLAQKTLGDFYTKGIPTALGKDIKRAYAWYKVAAENKHYGSEAMNGRLHTEMLLRRSENELEEAKSLFQEYYNAQKDKNISTQPSSEIRLAASDLLKLLSA